MCTMSHVTVQVHSNGLEGKAKQKVRLSGAHTRTSRTPAAYPIQFWFREFRYLDLTCTVYRFSAI